MKEVIIDDNTYIGDEPSGYDLLKFCDKYLDKNGQIKEGSELADMTVELVAMIFKMPVAEVKKLKWSVLSKLSKVADEVFQETMEEVDQKK